jgi:hypothetical protein
LSPPINFAVVRLPGRKHAGIIVQGDTFYIMQQQVFRIMRLLEVGALKELSDEVEDLGEQLSHALVHFEQVCADRGIELPYQKY